MRERNRVAISFQHAPSRVRPEFREETDINNIIAKYRRTGVMPTGTRIPRYEDLSNAVDYHQALNLVNEAVDAFRHLPARIRDYFSNDPREYLAGMEAAHDPDADPEYLAELRELGALPPMEPVPAPPAPTPTPTPSEPPEEPPAAS